MDDVILKGTECVNISSGGMCLTINDRIDLWNTGMLIMVRKYKREAIYFKTDFSVTWNSLALPGESEVYMGIAFKELDAANKKALDRILSLHCNVDN